LKKERDELPSYHKRMIDEQFERLKTREEAIQQHEVSIKLEESRRLANIEELKKSMLEEVSTLRRNTELSLESERSLPST
jgi:hypothetical protein